MKQAFYSEILDEIMTSLKKEATIKSLN